MARWLSQHRRLQNAELDVLPAQLEQRINTPLISSVGRLFDAVASLAGVRQKINYEAQAEVELEAMTDPDEKGSILSVFCALGTAMPVIGSTPHPCWGKL
jgi:hydrogenase maturation factor HypF (carbamoyltransferase family)